MSKEVKIPDGYVKIKAVKEPKEGAPQHMEVGKTYIVGEDVAGHLVKAKRAVKV